MARPDTEGPRTTEAVISRRTLLAGTLVALGGGVLGGALEEWAASKRASTLEEVLKSQGYREVPLNIIPSGNGEGISGVTISSQPAENLKPFLADVNPLNPKISSFDAPATSLDGPDTFNPPVLQPGINVIDLSGVTVSNMQRAMLGGWTINLPPGTGKRTTIQLNAALYSDNVNGVSVIRSVEKPDQITVTYNTANLSNYSHFVDSLPGSTKLVMIVSNQ